jgi:transposase
MDVHQASVTAVVRDCEGKIRMRSVMETSARAVLDFLGGLRGTVWVTFEEGTQSQWLHDTIAPHVALFTELDVLSELRPKAKRAMVAEARRHRAWKILLGIPFFGPVRVAQLISIVVTPHRFRGKRQLWPYAGLAVVTRSSADYEPRNGRFERRRRPPMTRGLNRNHNPVLKDVFKGAAQAAIGRPGPLKDLYDASVARGVSPDMAKLTLARKIASVTLRLWKRAERYDPAKLTMQAT